MTKVIEEMGALRDALDVAQDELTDREIESGGLLDYEGDVEECTLFIETFNTERCDWRDCYGVPLRKEGDGYVLAREPYPC